MNSRKSFNRYVYRKGKENECFIISVAFLEVKTVSVTIILSKASSGLALALFVQSGKRFESLLHYPWEVDRIKTLNELFH